MGTGMRYANAGIGGLLSSQTHEIGDENLITIFTTQPRSGSGTPSRMHDGYNPRAMIRYLSCTIIHCDCPLERRLANRKR